MKSFIAALLLASVAGIGTASADWRLGSRPTLEEREQYEIYHYRNGDHEAARKKEAPRNAPRDAFGRVPSAQPSIHPDFFDYERSSGRS